MFCDVHVEFNRDMILRFCLSHRAHKQLNSDYNYHLNSAVFYSLYAATLSHLITTNITDPPQLKVLFHSQF